MAFNNNKDRPSRRNAWIQKRWKSAVQSVCNIGFKTFEEMLHKVKDDDEDEDVDTELEDHSKSQYDARKRRSSTPACHLFAPMDGGDHEVGDEISVCYVCEECIEKDENNDDQDALKCQRCHMVMHDGCQLYLTSTNCQPKISKGKEHGSSKTSSHGRDGTPDACATNVDPIYLALKKGNKIATQRKQSVAECPPRGASQTRDVTPSSETTNRSSSGANMAKMACNGSSSYNSFASNASSSSSTHLSTVAKSLASRASPARQNLDDKQEHAKLGSAPNLVAQKSIESQDEGITFKKPIQKPAAAVAAVRRAPKLDSKMKSLSLDCPDATVARKGGVANALLSTKRHALRVPPCKYSSFESADDTARSSTSCSPCPSACGSTLILPSNSYAVTHDYYAKFPEEIDLRVGERVLIVDNSDPDWWQGHNVSGRLGIFPATCVAHIHCNEQVMQIVQNVCLWVGNKNHRLYRDQIIFALLDEDTPEGMLTVRTERDFRINCPLEYLMSLE